MQHNLANVWHRFRWASAHCQSETQQTLLGNLHAYDTTHKTQTEAQVRRRAVCVHVRVRSLLGLCVCHTLHAVHDYAHKCMCATYAPTYEHVNAATCTLVPEYMTTHASVLQSVSS